MNGLTHQLSSLLSYSQQFLLHSSCT